ncbi:MAG: AAA family ATPase [Lachnospiraceae bacterium]|nr:AAA family ATPase [Lachnospiraceae bacterium]
MATPVLIIGKSGSGKSTSMRNCQNDDFNLIRVLNKPLPFKGKVNGWFSDDYQQIMKLLIASKADSIVIDDAGYLITNHFMRGHSSAGKGNGVFSLYNDIGDYFWNLIQFIVTKVPENKIVYIIMHEEKDEAGEVKPKTIGKLLDEKVCIEGMFTIVLRCIEEGGKHLFVTQASQGAVSKSPIGMFEDLTIDNDLLLVDKKIREYYGLAKGEENNAETK